LNVSAISFIYLRYSFKIGRIHSIDNFQ
jgi:hypothetical protein